MKKKTIDLSPLREYQKPMINVIDVLSNDSAVMAMSYTVIENGDGTDYTPGGGGDLHLR